MKQHQINSAYQALSKLSTVSFPVKKAYKIFILLKKIKEEFQFSIDREKLLIEKYGGSIQNDGVILFKDDSVARQFKNEIEELNDMDVEIEVAPIKLSGDEYKEYKISPSEMLSLDGLIEFECDE